MPMNPDPKQGMAFFSFLMGLMSLIMMLFGVGLPFAALGLVVALLSRGDGPMLPRARTGLVLSAVGLAMSLFITVSSILIVQSGFLQESYDELRETLSTTYGENEADEMMEQFDELFRDTAPSQDNASVSSQIVHQDSGGKAGFSPDVYLDLSHNPRKQSRLPTEYHLRIGGNTV